MVKEVEWEIGMENEDEERKRRSGVYMMYCTTTIDGVEGLFATNGMGWYGDSRLRALSRILREDRDIACSLGLYDCDFKLHIVEPYQSLSQDVHVAKASLGS